MYHRRRIRRFWCVLTLLLPALGCQQEMANQGRYKPLEQSDFFANGTSARTPVAGTVARGQLRIDPELYEGKIDGKPADTFPFPITREDLLRGQQRYDIFCAACHDYTGSGRGMVVRRGFPAARSFHTDKLREAPPGHFFEVITKGFGRMPAHASQVPPEDRWRIIAYIRALQLSQHAQVAQLPTQDTQALKKLRP